MRSIPFVLIAILSLVSPASSQEAADPPASEAPAPKPLKPAELRAEELDRLMARLRTVSGPDRMAIEQKIWELWQASDSPTAEILLQQAQAAMDDGAPAESLSILDRLVGAYPDFAEAWNKRATLYYLMHRDAAAMADIEKVLDLEPRHFGALAGRGLIYQRERKYGLARAAFQDALAINPGMEAIQAAVKELDKLEQGI
jgi:tetratricopeptide (TPR) repeat protein